MPDDFQYVKLPDGSYGKFRSDATDETIRSAISKDFPDAFKAKESPMAATLAKTTGISAHPSQGPVIDTIQKAREWLENKVTSGSESGAGEFMASAPLGVLRAAKGVAEMRPGQPTWQGMKDVVGGSAQAFTMPAMVIAPEAAEAGAGLVPSAARAGKKLEEVMEVARNVPIKPGVPVAEALRGKEIASRGANLPKILRDFVRRTSDPEAPPITYEEARDFYTNARMSMTEYLQNKPNMWRQVTIFKNALGNAVADAAHEAGKGSEYLSGMAEYRKAKRLQELIQAAAKIGIPLAIGYKLNKAINTMGSLGQ